MLRSFWKDRRGNFGMLTAFALVPIMGAVALAVDYTGMVREKQDTLNALDAAGIATARYISSGASDDEAITYANDFFMANLSAVPPSNVKLNVLLPRDNTGGGTLKLTATLKYDPYFLPVAAMLVGQDSKALTFDASSEIQLKNTVEVALVLDNSGSMDYYGTGSGKKRIDLLKAAAKQLISTLAGQAAMIKQVAEPVRFGVVPFSASVNVGPDNYYVKKATWLDLDGISPIHHENFDWTSFGNSNNTSNRRVIKNAVTGIYEKKGSDWGTDQVDTKVTRFTLFDEMKYYTDSNQTKKAPYSSWAGCVEQRPSPYDVNDAPANPSNPATMFVPMFAPDQVTGDYNDWFLYERNSKKYYWNDISTNSSARVRQAYMPKYFDLPTIGYVAPYRTQPAGMDAGPNASCSTQPITPLTDVTNVAGMTKVKDAIDAMEPQGATSVGSGLAWGWRVVSSGAPFTEGRPETEKGNDKVVIVLTDGANTYYTPDSLRWGSDSAGTKSTYADYGFMAPYNADSRYSPRMFLNTSSNVVKSGSGAFDNSNYTKAMNEQMATLCQNAKDSKILIMTVSLDIDPSKLSSASERAAAQSQIDGLKSCASESRYRKDPDDPSKPAKLYWNATGADLSDKFKEIADELSNLRIVG
ncbi:TadE/TadG family type IV pilus assembly protein [Ollibium composti]|uniref:Putative Flp pilus-assembly TadG-like N-terminal domain-containing protein n=1 Tax=Ollibium composti TaxID=2675109 RepID=A0ABY2Q9G7_9HYPH|nr:TadE/TadG family type IV pilus assembly protein [Mesorhizobium composti]THF58505.1 hypothetical protein E6C48_07885 [Mesorhizobium composti]